MALLVKNPPAYAGDVRHADLIPGWEDPLEEGTAPHAGILTWKIPWAEKLGEKQFMGSQRVGHD